MASFGFEEDLVAFFVCKFDDFILDGRAVARAGTFDFPGIHGGLIKVVAYDIVGFWGGVGDVARDLFHVELRAEPGTEVGGRGAGVGIRYFVPIQGVNVVGGTGKSIRYIGEEGWGGVAVLRFGF